MDPCIHGEDPLDQKNADGRTDGQTDGFSALYSRLLMQLPGYCASYI